MRIQFFRSTWGMDLPTLEENLTRIKQGGFDGVELGVPDDTASCQRARGLLDQLGLAVIAQQWTRGETSQEHLVSFEKQFERSALLKPLQVNSHTGKDYFSLAENLAVFDHASKLSAAAGIPVVHETHRARALFSAPATVAILDARPELRLTADFSHWCCVHETLLEDQQSAVEKAMDRSYHIHARVGHSQGPQITDPRDSAWEPALSAHLTWWKNILHRRRQEGCEVLSICPEFGPPPYMVVQPYSQKPIADLWEINCHMMKCLKSAFTTERA